MQAIKLLDIFSKISLLGQQLVNGQATSLVRHIKQLRLELLSNIVQLMVPIAPVPDMFQEVIAPFRKRGSTANIRHDPVHPVQRLQGCCMQPNLLRTAQHANAVLATLTQGT